MKLYLVHCGFYDPDIGAGLYENHTNILICAEDIAAAKVHVKKLPEFKKRGMHIDGLMEIEAVQGHRIICEEDPALDGKTRVAQLKYGSRAAKVVELD